MRRRWRPVALAPTPVSIPPTLCPQRLREPIRSGPVWDSAMLRQMSAKPTTRRFAIVWPDALFKANPRAFMAGDRNRLRLGAVLTIPDGVGPAAGATAVSPATSVAASAVSTGPASGVALGGPVAASTPAPRGCDRNYHRNYHHCVDCIGCPRCAACGAACGRCIRGARWQSGAISFPGEREHRAGCAIRG